MRFTVPYYGQAFTSPTGKCIAVAGEPEMVKWSNGTVDWRMTLLFKIDGEEDSFGFSAVGMCPNIALSISDNGAAICAVEDNSTSCLVWVWGARCTNGYDLKITDTHVSSVGISEDGAICCYCTDLSAIKEHDQKAFVMNVNTRDIITILDIGQIFGHGILPDVKSIDGEMITFALKGFDVHVSLSGEIINSKEWLNHRYKEAEEDNYGYSLYYISFELEPYDALFALKHATEKEFIGSGKDKAKVYRRIGELLETEFDELDGAIAAYQVALSIDEYVGVKTRLRSLEKKIRTMENSHDR